MTDMAGFVFTLEKTGSCCDSDSSELVLSFRPDTTSVLHSKACQKTLRSLPKTTIKMLSIKLVTSSSGKKELHQVEKC